MVYKKGLAAEFKKLSGDNAVGVIQHESVSWGLMGLDYLFKGGLPRGKIGTLWGEAGTGKTTLALIASKSIIDQGGGVVYINLDHGCTESSLRRVGITQQHQNDEQFVFRNCLNGEDAGKAIMQAIDFNYDLVVIDSLPYMMRNEVYEKDPGERNYAAVASFLAEFSRMLKPATAMTGTGIISINEARANTSRYGHPLKMGPCGYAWAHVCDYIGFVSKLKLDDKNDVGAHLIKVQMQKSRCGTLKNSAEFEFYQKSGIDFAADVVNVAIECGVIEKKASMYYINGAEKGVRGFNTVKELIKSDSALTEDIKKRCYDYMAQQESEFLEELHVEDDGTIHVYQDSGLTPTSTDSNQNLETETASLVIKDGKAELV